MTPGLVKLEVAVTLYRDRKPSMGKAARIAELSRPAFQLEVGRRGVTIDHEIEDLHADLEACASSDCPEEVRLI